MSFKLLAFHHVCIQTPCYKESRDFYLHVLQCELVKETPDFHSRQYNTWLRTAGGVMIELQTAKQGDELLPWSSRNGGPVHMCLVVDDVRKAYDEIRAKGWRRFKQKKSGEEFYQVNGSWIFKVSAPEGTEIEIRDDPAL